MRAYIDKDKKIIKFGDKSALLTKDISQIMKQEENNKYFVYFYHHENNWIRENFNNENERDRYYDKTISDWEDYLNSQNTGNKQKGKNMLETLKKYYKDHEDVLFPLMVVVVLDHFFNNGGLRERIMALAERLLSGIQNKLLPETKKDE